jgi:hypothetical protein
MLDTALLASTVQQLMSGKTVDVNGKSLPVRRTSRHRLRTLAFTMDGREFKAIGYNRCSLSSSGVDEKHRRCRSSGQGALTHLQDWFFPTLRHGQNQCIHAGHQSA